MSEGHGGLRLRKHIKWLEVSAFRGIAWTHRKEPMGAQAARRLRHARRTPDDPRCPIYEVEVRTNVVELVGHTEAVCQHPAYNVKGR